MRTYYKVNVEMGEYGPIEEREKVNGLDEADLVSSRSSDPEDLDEHYPVFDIDFDAELLPSSTEGHFHLYLNKKMPWRKYKKLLKAMKDAEIINDGWYKMAIERHEAHLRAPLLLKEESVRSDEEVYRTALKLKELEKTLSSDVSGMSEDEEKSYWKKIKEEVTKEQEAAKESLMGVLTSLSNVGYSSMSFPPFNAQTVQPAAPALTGYSGVSQPSRRPSVIRSPYPSGGS